MCECPYCGAELDYDCDYGTGLKEKYYGNAANGIHYPSTYEKSGDIYECPNGNGFKDEDEAMAYLNTIGETLESLGVNTWEEVECLNERGNGYYYDDNSGDLKDGYPC